MLALLLEYLIMKLQLYTCTRRLAVVTLHHTFIHWPNGPSNQSIWAGMSLALSLSPSLSLSLSLVHCQHINRHASLL